jgi:hypothetical protein
MAERNPTDLLSGHLALYTYLEPIWRGRSVLEVGCQDGARADHLAAHGAGRVVALDRDRGAIDRARHRFRRPRLEFRALPTWADIATAVTGTFDVVLVPDGELLLEDQSLIPRVRALMSSLGRLVVAVRSGERRSPLWRSGVGYYELADTLSTHFARVKMFGQTPFLGFGLVEFEGNPEAVRVETALVDSGEAPCDYVALAGVDDGPPLGYALVQVPFTAAETLVAPDGREGAPAEGGRDVSRAEAEVERLTRELTQLRARGANGADTLGALEARLVQAERRADEVERRARARAEEDEERLLEVRRKLETAWSDAEAAQRIARAQASEIDELRARVRRAHDDRVALDAELAALRRALAEADESVVRLTRRTAEEMSAVAERLTAGLLGTEEGAAERSKVHQQLAAAEEQIVTLRVAVASAESKANTAKVRLDEAVAKLAEAEALARQLSERDDRIVLLEGEKQDLTWRLAEAETALARASKASLPLGPRSPASPVAASRASVESERPAPARAQGGALAAPPRPAATVEEGPARAALVADETVSARIEALERELAQVKAARDRTVEEFHKVSAAHLQEVHRLRGQVSEQAALVSELEDQVRAAETRAQAAEKELGTARAAAKSLDDADRARRSRLAELEGKLLRLQHEKRQQPAGGDPAAEQAWQQKLQVAEQRALVATQEAAAAADGLAKLGAEVASLRAENRALAEKLAAREVAPVAATPASSGMGGGTASETTRRALFAIEERLLEEAREVATLEATVAKLEAEVRARGTLTAPERSEFEHLLGEKDGEIERQRRDLAEVRRQVELLSTQLANREALVVEPGTAEGTDVHVQLMHNTLSNIRRRAARLRDEVEGYRRRAEALSPRAVSSILEEIGEDLAEFAKA